VLSISTPESRAELVGFDIGIIVIEVNKFIYTSQIKCLYLRKGISESMTANAFLYKQ
jgi:hypothetical protein